MIKLLSSLWFKLKFYFWERKTIKEIEKHYARENKRKKDLDRNETI